MAGDPQDQSALNAFVRRLRRHASVSEEDAGALEALPHKVIHLRNNAQLVREGDRTDRCLILARGFMHRFRNTEAGERQILAIYVPGDPVDFDHIFLPVADDGLQVLSDSALLSVQQSDLRQIMASRPAVAEAICRALLVDASIFREWTLNVGRRDARTRIAHLLCEISLRMAVQGFDVSKVPLPLTQDELADATGLTTIHVNRTLRSLTAEKYIERRGGLVMLPKPDALKELAGFDARYLHVG